MLNKIDDYLMDKFQQFSNWWQKLTGFTNFWLARLSFVLAIVSIILLCSIFYRMGGQLSVFAPVVYLVALIAIVLFVRDIHDLKKEEMVFTKKITNTLNGRMVKNKKSRISQLCVWFIFSISSIFWLSSGVFLIKALVFAYISSQSFVLLGFYFGDCTPLPPSKGKLKILLEKVGGKINEKFSEKPDTFPVKS